MGSRLSQGSADLACLRHYGNHAEHSFEWNFLLDGEPTIVESQGSGSFPAEAEIAAMQDMYIKVQEVRMCSPGCSAMPFSPLPTFS